MAGQIRGHARCKICGKTFYGAIATVLGAAGQPDPDHVGYLEQLQEHIKRDHKPENKVLELRSFEFLAMLYLMNFSTTDSLLTKQMDFLRWQIHQQTLGAQMSDEQMLHATAQLADALTDIAFSLVTMTFDRKQEPIPEYVTIARAGLKADILRKVRHEFEELRNLLQEPGRYQMTTVIDPNGLKN